MEQSMTSPKPGQQPARQLRLEIPANLNAIYSNAVVVSHTSNEIVLDFTQIMPNDPRARVQQRIVMTPVGAKLFLNALEENLGRFEKKYGEVNLPPKPVSLAEQLFGNLKQTDDDEEPGQDDDNG
jgi:hypothetical protein